MACPLREHHEKINKRIDKAICWLYVVLLFLIAAFITVGTIYESSNVGAFIDALRETIQKYTDHETFVSYLVFFAF
jgi:uncharacterized membrane protein